MAYTDSEVHIKKAVITAAAKRQRTLPMQMLMDEQGAERSVLSIIVKEAVRAGAEEICVVVYPGDALPYAKLVEEDGGRIHFVEQHEPRGYGHAIWCAKNFTADDAFLHLVGDHIYVGEGTAACAQKLVEVASAEGCAVSAVQVTRENLLPYFGTVGAKPVVGRQGLYRINTVIEKPSPTEAEQRLLVPGLRNGQYLCFYGMHVLTPAVMDLLSKQAAEASRLMTLSAALAELAGREQYLALLGAGRRFDIGVQYGLFYAQLALALSGGDRDRVLADLLEVVAMRGMATA